MAYYDNFNDFKRNHERTAELLLEDVGEGEWMKEQIYYYKTLSDFAEYELTDGWYADLSLDGDFRGAPNPMDYIDLEALGEALSNTWDDSCYWTDGECVVGTSTGW